jgi:hypothetical protein
MRRLTRKEGNWEAEGVAEADVVPLACVVAVDDPEVVPDVVRPSLRLRTRCRRK